MYPSCTRFSYVQGRSLQWYTQFTMFDDYECSGMAVARCAVVPFLLLSPPLPSATRAGLERADVGNFFSVWSAPSILLIRSVQYGRRMVMGLRGSACALVANVRHGDMNLPAYDALRFPRVSEDGEHCSAGKFSRLRRFGVWRPALK